MKISETVIKDLEKYMIKHSLEKMLEAQATLAALRSNIDYIESEDISRNWNAAKARISFRYHRKELAALMQEGKV